MDGKKLGAASLNGLENHPEVGENPTGGMTLSIVLLLTQNSAMIKLLFKS